MPAATGVVVKVLEGWGNFAVAGGDDLESSLRFGERALLVAGSLREARAWFDNAYRTAEERGDLQAMARAALGLGGLWVHEHRTAAESALVGLRQRDVLALIDPGSSLALRLRLRLVAEEDYLTGRHSTIVALLAQARRAGDPIALAEALNLAHQCAPGPEHGEFRAETATELIGQAMRTGRRSDLLMGLLWRTVGLFLDGDPHAARTLRELRAELRRRDHLAIGYVLDAIEVMLAIRDGRFTEAEARAEVCADSGFTAGDIDRAGRYGCQIATIRWFQGRMGDLVPMLSELADSPSLSAIDHAAHAGLALAAAHTGDRRMAAGALARLRGRDLSELPRSSSWLMSLHGVVEAAHLLADQETATQAYDLLTPYARLPVITGLGACCLGSVHHSLGMAALTTHDTDRAVRHLRLAVRDNLALGHWPAAVLSRCRLGHALTLAGGPADEALGELALAEQEAAALGMVLPAEPEGRRIGRGGRARVGCRRKGRGWRISFGGRSVLVDDSVGMRHLATLLANPGQEVKAVELASGLDGPGTAAVSAQPVLDETAKRQYRERLALLEADIDEFEARNESDRAATVRAERDWLIAELASAAGMGGRTRQFADGEERARIAVGKALRRALSRVAEAEPVIGAELKATVRTGLRCCYNPS